MKAVILESYVMEEGDLDWSGVKALVPDTVSYVRTAYEEIAPRIGDADIVLLNKCRMDEEILQQCPNLKWVGIIATGTDNLDLEACRRHGVAVANVPGYSTYSVAQMTFSLLLAICPVRGALQPCRQAGMLAAGYPGEHRPAAPDGALWKDLWRLRLWQHWAAVGPHCQSLWHGGAGLHPHRPA